MSEDDDRWVLRVLRETKDVRYYTGCSSYRYMHPNGVVHRAVWWEGRKWQSLCGEEVCAKLREDDPGAVTCVRCLGEGA